MQFLLHDVRMQMHEIERDDALAKLCTQFPAWVHPVASLSLLLALRITLIDRAFASSSSAQEELRHRADLHKHHFMRY